MSKRKRRASAERQAKLIAEFKARGVPDAGLPEWAKHRSKPKKRVT